MKIILFFLLVVCSIASSIMLGLAVFGSYQAIQQCTLAALACGIVIVPYCLLRGIDTIGR